MKQNNGRKKHTPKGSNGSLRISAGCGALSLSTMQIRATAASVSRIIFEVDALKTALCFIDPHSISWFAKLAPRIRSSRHQHYCRHSMGKSLALLSRIFLTLVWLRYRVAPRTSRNPDLNAEWARSISNQNVRHCNAVTVFYVPWVSHEIITVVRNLLSRYGELGLANISLNVLSFCFCFLSFSFFFFFFARDVHYILLRIFERHMCHEGLHKLVNFNIFQIFETLYFLYGIFEI